MDNSLIFDEIANGHGMLLSQAVRRFPSNRNNRPVTLSCILRWIIDGVVGPTGERVRLEAARCAGNKVGTQGTHLIVT
jgi:hypothetical protein